MQSEHADLGRLPYFVGLTPSELEAASCALSPVEVAQNEVIFAQGEDGGWVYILVRGAVEISIETPHEGQGKDRRILTGVQAPALLGEMAVLLQEPRSAWAVATTPCLLLQVSRESVRRALEEDQKWAQRLLLAMSKILAARLSEMNRRLAALATQCDHALKDDLATLQQSLFVGDES